MTDNTQTYDRAFQCPERGSAEEFAIEASSLFTFTKAQGQDYGSIAWPNEPVEWRWENACESVACGHRGTVDEFMLSTRTRNAVRPSKSVTGVLDAVSATTLACERPRVSFFCRSASTSR